MESLGTQILNDPTMQSWVEENIARLRKAQIPDDVIRRDFLKAKEYAALPDSLADRFIAPVPVTPNSPSVPSTHSSLPAALRGLPFQLGPVIQALGFTGDNAGQNYLGAGAAAARGLSLGATDYIPPLKHAATGYQERQPFGERVVETTGALASPVGKVLKAAKGVPFVGDALAALGKLLQPTEGVAVQGSPGFLRAAGRMAASAGKGLATGAANAGIYGFNTSADPSLGGRAVNAIGNAAVGGGLGAVMGGASYPIAARSAAQAARQAGNPSPAALGLLRNAFETEGGIPATVPEGQVLLDQAGPLGKSLFQEAVGRSDKALVQANQWKANRIKALGDDMNAVAADVVGLGHQGKTFPNPYVLHRELIAQSKADAAPFYAKLNAENPAVPSSPLLSTVLSAPPIKQMLGGKSAQVFADTRDAADAVRKILGQGERGAVAAGPEAIAAAQGISPAEAALEKRLGPLNPTTRAMIRRDNAGQAKDLDWRTLNLLKIRLDEGIEGKQAGRTNIEPSLQKITLADLRTLRSGLLKALDDAVPDYAKARALHAEPLVAAEMLHEGIQAARTNADKLEALLTDPETLALGQNAVDHAKLGALSALREQMKNVTPEMAASGSPWTPDRIRIFQLVADKPNQQALLPAIVERTGKLYGTTGLIPSTKLGIQTGPTETTSGAAAAAATGLASGSPWYAVRQIGSVARSQFGRMSPKDAEDIVQAFLHPNPQMTLKALVSKPTLPASQGAAFAGRGVGTILNPLP